jgi:hypothetical protein
MCAKHAKTTFERHEQKTVKKIATQQTQKA